jgi:integrase
VRISNQQQADKAPIGVHKITGATGLSLKIGETGKGSYFYRFRLGDRRREMGLGARDEITLVDAREAAAEHKAACKRGEDPIEERKRVRAANLAKSRAAKPVVFKEMVEAYLAKHAPGWKHRYARQSWVNPLVNYGYPVIGHLGLDEIEIAHIVEIMERAEKAGAPDLARRIRLRVEQVLNSAIALSGKAMRNSADIKLIGAVRPMKRKKGDRTHFRAVDLKDAPKVFQELKARAASDSVLAAWCFMVLTAARPSEALKAQWSEIKDERLWVIPSERMKSGQPHEVPLSTEALTLLKRQRDMCTGDSIFPGRGGSPRSYASFAKAAAKAEIDAATPHGWRSVFRSWAGNVASIERDLAEAALAHSLGDVEAAYWRGSRAVDRRREVMERYSQWLNGESAQVIEFPGLRGTK